MGVTENAAAIAHWHVNQEWDHTLPLPAGFTILATGSQRTAYLHTPTTTVYKVGDDGANRYEHAALTTLRTNGHRHAPETSLHRVNVTDYSDCEIGLDPTTTSRDIITMPYLPEDGTAPHNDGTFLAGMTDLNPDNIHAHGGQLWLIDAGGL